MPHHVARLLTPPGLPLSSILQAAAAQAWSRRAHLNRTRTVATRLATEVNPQEAPASSFMRVPPPHLQRSRATSENDIPDYPSAKDITETTSTSRFTRAASPHLQVSSATHENNVQDRSSAKLATETTPSSSFIRAAPPHLQGSPAVSANDAAACSSTQATSGTTPTSNFIRVTAPHFQPSPATSANDVRDYSSPSTDRHTDFPPSKRPAFKPIHNTSLRPHSRNYEFPEDAEGLESVLHIREIIPNPTPKMSRSVRLPHARPINHKALSTHDFDWRDPERVTDAGWSDLPLATGTPVYTQGETLPYPTMKQPTTPNEVYRNLLRLISNGPFTLRAVINYYLECPDSIHSTKSFNLLIGLALRNASFKAVGRLLNVMEVEDIPRNMETWKLHVRWLVRTDRWDEAWKLVMVVTQQKNASTMHPNDPIPLDLWLELLGSQKRGALRNWTIMKLAPSTEHVAEPNMQTDPESSWDTSDAVAGFDGGWGADLEGRDQGGLDSGWDNSAEAVAFLPSQIHHGHEKRLVPRPWQKAPAVEHSQYRAAMQVSPLHQAPDDVKLSPRTILVITRAMYRVGQRNLAVSTALSYLASLPPRLRRRERRDVLDIVHLHLAMATRRGKPGLKQHFAQRRMLRKFVVARPNLTPTSMTLFLLLGPLRGCRRSGTLAMQCLRLFEKRWGSRCMQSKMVRRRIANLALKEGRLDIVRSIIKSEWKATQRVIYDEIPRIVSPTRSPTRRLPWREMFGRRGVWNRRWRMIEEKYYLKSKQPQKLSAVPSIGRIPSPSIRGLVERS